MEQSWGHFHCPEALICLQSGEVHRGVLDQLYSSEAEAMPTGPSEARDAHSTVSR